MTPNYVVTVEFVVHASHLDAFLVALIANARASREREPGCRQFDVCTDPANALGVYLYEVFDDRAAFDAHVETPHFRDFNAHTASWVERKTVRTYLRADPAQ